MGEMMRGTWDEIKGKIRKTWGKLTDDDLAKAEGNWEELQGRLERTYGYTKDQAKEEIDKFKNTLM